MVKTKIEKLRHLMQKEGLDLCYIPTSDNHDSEYVAEHFKLREYLSGFTGSAGTLIITKDKAGLWTDGRYFIQAEKQLKDTEIKLYRLGFADTCSPLQFIQQELPEKGVCGFNGQVISAQLGEEMEEVLKSKSATLRYDLNFAEIWTDQPPLPSGKAFTLDIKYTGESTASKLAWLRNKLAENKIDCHLLSSLDDIAWLFNIRGTDVACTPVVYSYAIITKDATCIYMDENKLTETIKVNFACDNIQVYPYDSFLTAVCQLKNQTILVDQNRINYATLKRIADSNQIVDHVSPVVLRKARKNEVELAHLRQSHIQDGLAVTEFIYWLKKQIKTQKITEVTAADYLEQCRRARGCIDLSFPTICAYNANAAMMHYSATLEHCATLKPEGILLVDSGGHYLQGTTDITRTIALGPVSEQWKKYNTAVLKGMLNLSNAKFLSGCTGLNLDILARGPVWQLDLDYQCGTGHGVGYMLSVHEGPHGIRWKPNGTATSTVLEEGMVVTNEPGIYLQAQCGIRIENELIVKKGVQNFYGQFMEFETLTFAPIDLDLILPEMLTDQEKAMLNQYHQDVYNKLQDSLSGEIQHWLKEVTRPI